MTAPADAIKPEDVPAEAVQKAEPRKYKPEKPNLDGWSDWIHPISRYRFSCCDCGLVHNLELRIDDLGRPNFRMSRNNRATGQLRRHRSHTHTHRAQPEKRT